MSLIPSESLSAAMRAFRLGMQLVSAGLAATIAWATLGPQPTRPQMTTSPTLDRFMAYVALGGALALAFPRHRRWTGAGVVAFVVLLELAQFLTPDRHGRLGDAVSKSVSAIIGWAAGLILSRVAARTVPAQG